MEEVGELHSRLQEAEETLRAIRNGEVDALVIDGTQCNQVFTLRGADHTYRILIETMNEGAASLIPDGTILYCNGRLAAMLKTPIEKVIGTSFRKFVSPLDLDRFEALFRRSLTENTQSEIALGIGNEILHVQLSVNMIRIEGTEYMNMVVTDLTEIKAAGDVLVKTNRELRKSQRQLRKLYSNLQSSLEDERARIAREIHDELGQALTGLKFDISWIQARNSRDRGATERLQDMCSLIDSTILTVQRISTELRPSILDHLGITTAIKWQTEQFQKRTGIACEFICCPADIVLDKERATTIFRIIQEALTNILRHADATEVRVCLEVRDGHVFSCIENNGRQIEKSSLSNPHSFGLLGMKERVRAFDGSVTIRGRRDKGTSVIVKVPLSKMDAREFRLR
jgi:two-component system, NarL family, sensor kinase